MSKEINANIQPQNIMRKQLKLNENVHNKAEYRVHRIQVQRTCAAISVCVASH